MSFFIMKYYSSKPEGVEEAVSFLSGLVQNKY